MEKLAADNAKPKVQTQWDKIGAIAGIGVFFLGIVLLIAVFFLAYQQFSAPVGNTSIQINPEGGQFNVQSDLVGNLLGVITKAVFLFVMGYCSSWIALRGLQMYRASKATGEKE